MASATFILLYFVIVLISGSYQHSVLLATSSGIKRLSLTTGVVVSLNNHPARTVDYRFNEKDLYFISNHTDQIYYSYFSGYTQTLSDPIPRVKTQSSLSGLAVDWVSYRLYYGSPSAGTLLRQSLSVSAPEEVTSQVFDLQDIVLDPYDRLVFFTKLGRLYSVTLADTMVTSHDLEVTQLALDLHSKELYLVYQGTLGVKHYGVSAQVESLYNGVELEGVTALAVYHGFILWVSPCGHYHCLYHCQRSSCQANVTDVWRTSEMINDIKIYSPLAQTPNVSEACTLCSHGCDETSAECTCPEDMELEDDDTKCIDKPLTWDRRLEELLHSAINSCQQWFNSVAESTRPYWYTGGGLVLALLLCLVCLLMTVPCCQPEVEDDDDDEEEEDEYWDDIPLGDMHYHRCPNKLHCHPRAT